MLEPCFKKGLIEAGCDEAGRGCLAGPVYAAAVILPPGFKNPVLNDSKKLSRKNRDVLRYIIESEALDFAVAWMDPPEIDTHNILNASIFSMHRAISKLKSVPAHILVDGNRFKPYQKIPHTCFVKGDGRYASIAAASILAKTYRDEFMEKLHDKFPMYGWNHNMGYPTQKHREAIMEHGITGYHRKSFRLFDEQLKLEFN